MKLSTKVLFTVLSTGIAMAHDTQEHGFQRVFIEKDDRPSLANGLNRKVLDANSVQDIEKHGFARFLGEDGPDNSKGIALTVVVLVCCCCLCGCCCCAGIFPVDSPKMKPVEVCFAVHILLMLNMLIFAGFFLSDAFHCDKCLYFAAGVEQNHFFNLSASFHQSTAQDPIGVEAKGYTGTVGKNLDKLLGYNARNYIVSKDISDNCGIWIVHPDQWKKLGQTIEVDATIGQGQISAGGILSASRSDGVIMESMTSTKSTSDCMVSFGTDNKLRNYRDDGVNTTTIIGEGNCKEVKYLDDNSKSAGLLDMETVVINRNTYAHVGLAIFLLIRLLQYISFFMALARAEPLEIELPGGLKDSVWCKWMTIKFAKFLDGVFYTQMPMFVVEPLTGTNFIQDCSSVLAFRFNPVMWVVAVVFSSLGLIARGVDFCLMAVSGSYKLWKLIKIIIDLALVAYVFAMKILLILRFGFSLILGFKVEWAFHFEFWPLSISVELDMFQIFACLFQVWDFGFQFWFGWWQYEGAPAERKEAAGAFGKRPVPVPHEEDGLGPRNAARDAWTL